MFHCPYAKYCSSIHRVTRQVVSYVRLLHASPNSPSVDVYGNGRLIARNLNFKAFTNYLTVTPGLYSITIYPTGKKDKPILNTYINVIPNNIYTAAVIGELPNISLLPIIEPTLPMVPGKTYVRIVHLSPNTPNIDAVFPTANITFDNISYKTVTNYKIINHGSYPFKLETTSGKQTILNVPKITFKPNRFYSIYVVGLLNGKPPLQILVPLDGNSYLKL